MIVAGQLHSTTESGSRVDSSVRGRATGKGRGLGVANIQAELIAMSAAEMGEWAATGKRLRQLVGIIRQGKNGTASSHVTPSRRVPAVKIYQSLQETGRPWVELALHVSCSTTTEEDEKEGVGRLRAVMKHNNGLQTRWSRDGMCVTCGGGLQSMMTKQRITRKNERGACIVETITHLKLRDIWLMDAQGNEVKWKSFSVLVGGIRNKRVADVMMVRRLAGGGILFTPIGHDLPMTSGDAHKFREIALSLLANYPELASAVVRENALHVDHGLEDEHHVFEVISEGGAQLRHNWSTTETVLDMDSGIETVESTIANFLGVELQTVRVVPHPWLTKLRPLWVGKRRWRQSREDYRKVVGANRARKAQVLMESASLKWIHNEKRIASAVGKLSWKQVHSMAAITAYQMQTLVRLKHSRLRLWNGQTNGHHCLVRACQGRTDNGTAHLVWGCPEAMAHWDIFVTRWGSGEEETNSTLTQCEGSQEEIFTLQRRRPPRWLVELGSETCKQHWDVLDTVANEMWALGCAVTLTAIWRRNVDRKHKIGGTDLALERGLQRYQAGVIEAYERYRLSLYPVMAATVMKMKVADYVISRWRTLRSRERPAGHQSITRVGFFDGGSRGNPGIAGSGSVIVEVGPTSDSARIVWAAATALGRRKITNNEAEFVGLQRLLAYASEKGWEKMQVVGDSALILRMMVLRRSPKARNLQHWYRITTRLAGLTVVQSWSHHYRKYNKMADWLANYAMDTRRSVALAEPEEQERLGFTQDLMDLRGGDVDHWLASERRVPGVE